MILQIARWGNSLAVRIPQAFAKQAALIEGRPVDMTLVDGALMIAPVQDIPRYKLDDLISGISPENCPHERDIIDAEPIGKEIW